MMASVDSSTTVVLERDPGEPDCEVCSVDGSTRSCSPTEKVLSNAVNLTLEFSCLAPQNVFGAKIMKHIGERFAQFLDYSTFLDCSAAHKMKSFFNSFL